MRALRVLALIAVLVGAVTASAGAGPAAPGFRVKLLDQGRVMDSRELVGKKVLVLRFQASYCRKCARESAAFARVVDRYRGRAVEFVAIHVQDTAADTRRFIRAHKVTYPVALDPKLAIARPFGVKGTPDTVVVDLEGEMAARISGESAVTRLPRILDRALASARSGA